MADIADHMPSCASAQPLAHTQPDGLAAPWPAGDTKIRGFRLVLVWLSAILISWGLVGSLIYGGFELVSLLLS
jgi:hypothetical protein